MPALVLLARQGFRESRRRKAFSPRDHGILARFDRKTTPPDSTTTGVTRK
jgi:hypothetical protein